MNTIQDAVQTVPEIAPPIINIVTTGSQQTSTVIQPTVYVQQVMTNHFYRNIVAPQYVMGTYNPTRLLKYTNL